MKKIQNPLRPIYNLQDDLSAKNEIPSSPLYIDVEPTNLCNYKCNFCMRHQMKRETGFMPLDKFKKIAQSAKDAGVKAIRLVGWGEPFLNKNIYKMIQVINSLDMISHVTTNGTLVDINKILDSGLKSVYFSMQGLSEEEYSKLRNTDQYPLLKKNILQLIEERNKRGLDYPFVQITTSITDESKEEQQDFLEKWKKIIDDVSISYTWLERVDDKERVGQWLERSPKLPRRFRCNEVRSKLTVHWSGTVTPCCEDYDEIFNLGNAYTKPLQEIWDSPTAKGIRLILTEHGNQDMFVLCRKCELCHVFRGNPK